MGGPKGADTKPLWRSIPQGSARKSVANKPINLILRKSNPF